MRNRKNNLNDKGSLILIIINIILLISFSGIAFFVDKLSPIIYIIILPILAIILGVLIQFKNRNIFLVSLIALIPLGVLLVLNRGFDILVYLVFYMTSIGVSYLITAIFRNFIKEFE